MDNKTAYLVLSCDPFSDIWDLYGELFERFWSNCPYDKYFASHTKRFDKNGFSSVLIGEDISWSHGLIYVLNYLKQKGYEYVIPAFDDFIIVAPVNNEMIVNAVQEFIKLDGTKLDFDPNLLPRLSRFNDTFGKIPNHVPYRATLGFAVWNISRLLSILDDRESAWEFEKEGVERSFIYDDMYSLYEPAISFVNLIIKRKLVKKSYDKVKELVPDLEIKRDIFTNTFSERIRGKLLLWFIHYVPPKYQWKVYKRFSKPTKIDRKESLKKK